MVDAADPPDDIRIWEARRIPAGDRLAGYEERIAGSLFISSLTPMPGNGFDAKLREIRFGRSRAVRFSATPHLVTRLSKEVAMTSEDTIVAGLHLSDGVKVRAGGVEVTRSAGDIVALQSSSQFSLETSRAHDFEMLSLLFDASTIDGQVGKRKRQPAKLLAQRPATTALRNCMGLFGRRFARNASADELRALFKACEALVAAVFIEDRDFMADAVRNRRLVRTGLFLALCRHVEERLSDPALSPTGVARAFNITPRYVHQMFADEGLTFSTHLKERRLEGVFWALTMPGGAREDVAAIARRWGFDNRATFNRAFKARFQATPSQIAADARG